MKVIAEVLIASWQDKQLVLGPWGIVLILVVLGSWVRKGYK